jgi:outer membrane protein insertion porin family
MPLLRSLRGVALSAAILVFASASAFAQKETPESAPDNPNATATLREIRFEGLAKLTQEQAIALTGLKVGSPVNRKDLQDAADRLVATGLFTNVKYDFHTHNADLTLVFHVDDSPRLPVLFDNIPWFGDSELAGAIRQKMPGYDGTLPEAGNSVDVAAQAINDLLASHKINVTLNHQVLANPIGDGNVQEFSIEGASLSIAKMEFSDPALAQNPAVQQHLTEIVGKPYSRVAIDIFLSEHVRPIYLQKGHLRVKLGPAQIRLTSNPNQPLPTEIPVFIPVVPGPVYHFSSVQWSGNNVISSLALDSYFAFKQNEVADGMALQAAMDRITEEYARRGYLEAKVTPDPAYDDTANTISYKVQIEEGRQFHMGGFVLTGISPAAEAKIRATFPIANGEVFDKIKYEEYLTSLNHHSTDIWGELPVHYDEVGHWLRNDDEKSTVDILLDFK